MTQQRRAEKEDQLLEAATHLFKEKGYHSTSMQELADALGMQKGSLYYYIASKEELLRRLMERATSFMATQIDEIYASDLPPAQKLRWALKNHAVAMMDHLDPPVVLTRRFVLIQRGSNYAGGSGATRAYPAFRRLTLSRGCVETERRSKEECPPSSL